MIMKRVFKLKMPDSSENKWNDWTNLSQKYTDQVITNTYIKGDEDAWTNYHNRV